MNTTMPFDGWILLSLCFPCVHTHSLLCFLVWLTYVKIHFTFEKSDLECLNDFPRVRELIQSGARGFKLSVFYHPVYLMLPAWAIVLVPQSVPLDSKPDFLHHLISYSLIWKPTPLRDPSITSEVLPISKYSELSFRKRSPIEVLGISDCWVPCPLWDIISPLPRLRKCHRRTKGWEESCKMLSSGPDTQ